MSASSQFFESVQAYKCTRVTCYVSLLKLCISEANVGWQIELEMRWGYKNYGGRSGVTTKVGLV